MCRYLTVIALVLEIVCRSTCGAEGTTKTSEGTKPHNETDEGISNLVAGCFPHWDANNDGLLSIQELDDAITDPKVTGRAAALAVILRRDAVPHGTPQAEGAAQFAGWSRAVITSHFEDQAKQREFRQKYRHVAAMSGMPSRNLFMPGEPNLDSFRQGRVGDCFLLSRIAFLVHNQTQRVLKMITTAGDGYEIQFASGANVSVPCLTDGELLMGVHNGPDIGVWLSVLEKSYILMAAKVADKRGNSSPQSPKVVLEIPHRGKSDLFVPVCELLTGHKEKRISLKTGVAMNATAPRNGTKKAMLKRINDLLVETLKDKRIVMLATGKDPDKPLPKHGPGSHAYAVLEYNPSHRSVTIFNPHGKSTTPDGPPGLVNGYPTQNGTFVVPLEEMLLIFDYLAVETTERSPYPFLK